MEGEQVILEIEIIEEPARKKARLPEEIDKFIDDLVSSVQPLKAILSDEYDKPMPMTKVYVAQVKNVNEMSKIIRLLNEKFPLNELSHLKRACRKEVILFPASCITEPKHECIRKFIEDNLNKIKDSFEYYKIINVPAESLKTKKQFMQFGKSWSCHFHMDKYLESLINGYVFSENENKEHRIYMAMAFEIARFYLSKTNENLKPSDILSSGVNATVVVDPFNKSIVAVAFDNRVNHPMKHSVMIAIDNVARTQNGGAWFDNTDNFSDHLRGMGSMELFAHLQQKYPLANFAARKYISKSNLNVEETVKNLNDPKKYSQNYPYLCTGYYIYMIKEPCLMCAMALVHARSKRVFFAKKNKVGALCSKVKLQNLSSLNHHFEVFTQFL